MKGAKEVLWVAKLRNGKDVEKEAVLEGLQFCDTVSVSWVKLASYQKDWVLSSLLDLDQILLFFSLLFYSTYQF